MVCLLFSGGGVALPAEGPSWMWHLQRVASPWPGLARKRMPSSREEAQVRSTWGVPQVNLSFSECPEGWREDKPSSDSNLFPIRTVLLEQNKHPSRVTFCCCYCGNISVHHSWQNTKELVPVFVSFSLLFSARRAQASTINADLGLKIRLSCLMESPILCTGGQVSCPCLSTQRHTPCGPEVVPGLSSWELLQEPTISG